MRSIRKKLIASILICSLFTSVLIGILAISNSARTAGTDAEAKMQLTEQKNVEQINSVIQKIQQSVDSDLECLTPTDFSMYDEGGRRACRLVLSSGTGGGGNLDVSLYE